MNYEPNSAAGADRGPREDPVGGYTSFPAMEQGPKQRVRSESFADHFSQARQFLISQTVNEQQHIVNGFVFELSKVENLEIRTRMVANLRNVDSAFAAAIADGLGLVELPPPTTPARAPIADLPASAALSIVRNGPATFAGRKVGILVTDGTDADLLVALQVAIETEGAIFELIAPKIGGVTLTDGSLVPADQNIDGGPSVLYDAVALLTSADGATQLAMDAAAKDFVTDAHAHCKIIGHVESAGELLDAAGVVDAIDEGYVALDANDLAPFVTACRQIRFWDREPNVDAI